MPKRTLDAEAHFWSRVDRSAGEDGCWPWEGYVRADGYGQTRVFGQRKVTAAHRYAFLLSRGWLPTGNRKSDLLIRHRCDNRICCNPDHLEAGTHKENTADCRERGRWRYPARPTGHSAYRAKLDPHQVASARGRWSAGERLTVIAADLGVHVETARRVVKGQTYAAAALEAKAQMDDVLRGVG